MNETATQKWQASCLLERFPPFFEMVTHEDPKYHAELANQLRASAKMFPRNANMHMLSDQLVGSDLAFLIHAIAQAISPPTSVSD